MRKALALCLLLAACDTATVPLASTHADAEGKTFAPPPPGQAAVYIARGGDVGTLIQVTVGPRPLGPLGNYTWFRVDVVPGTLDVRCAGGEASRAVQVAVAAGETRFVDVKATTGWMDSRCAIAEVDAAFGRQLVLSGKRAIELR